LGKKAYQLTIHARQNTQKLATLAKSVHDCNQAEASTTYSFINIFVDFQVFVRM